MTIHYSDCPDQYISSDGTCTRASYAGNGLGPYTPPRLVRAGPG